MRSRLQAILEQKQLTAQGFASPTSTYSDPATDVSVIRKERTTIWGSRDCYVN
ncbi:hypothetical protein [Parathermosynechococcus lividus]